MTRKIAIQTLPTNPSSPQPLKRSKWVRTLQVIRIRGKGIRSWIWTKSRRSNWLFNSKSKNGVQQAVVTVWHLLVNRKLRKLRLSSSKTTLHQGTIKQQISKSRRT
jgi:hypothetical protein